MVGLNSVNTVKVYYPNSTTTYSMRQFNPTGNANYINFFHCDKDKYIVGSDNGNIYGSNNTNSFISASGLVRLATVDITNQFLAFGK